MHIDVLGICGSPIKGGNTEAYLKESLRVAEECGDVTTRLITLADKDIHGCKHCNWCVRKQEPGKFCNQQDDMLELLSLALATDVMVLATPVYIGRLSGYMATFLDRFRAFMHGKAYKYALMDKVGVALSVCWLRNAGGEMTLQSLVSAFLTFGMIPASTLAAGGSQYGAVGLSSEEGTGKFDPNNRLGVLQDEHGLHAARLITKRAVDLARTMKAGREALRAQSGLSGAGIQ